jgi:hypothetical protein
MSCEQAYPGHLNEAMTKEVEQDLGCQDHDIDLFVRFTPEIVRELFGLHGAAEHRDLGIAVSSDDSSLLEDQRDVVDNEEADLAL